MGRERALRTYGHHRHRCIATDACDIFWSASDESRQIFNTSSSESGLGPSDSVDSAEASLFGDRAAKNKALIKLQASANKNTKKENNKRKRPPSKKEGRLFSSDKDSSDCTTPATKRVSRRALHDKSNECHKQQTTKRQPAKRKQPRKAAAKKCDSDVPPKEQHCSINFSDFDDYSLIISDSPETGGKVTIKSLKNHIELGTSTPCISTSKRSRRSPEIQTADISFIPAIFERSDLIEEEEKSFDSCHSAAFSPPVYLQESSASPPGPSLLPQTERDSEVGGGGSYDQKNLERLEESFASLRVDQRRLRKRKTQTRRSAEPEKPSSSSSPVEAADQDSTDVETLRERSACVDTSLFDSSCSLFELVEPLEPAPQTLPTSDQEDDDEEDQFIDVSDSEAECLDLSAIVEDVEEEEEEEEEEEVVEEEEEEQECKKSFGLRPDLTHSFAEVLTPSKALSDSGNELSPLQKVLEQCRQDKPLPFTSIIPARILRKCVKIGEGVYGEVFRAFHNGESVALKIIPIEGDFEVNDEPQKTFKEILPEIVISNELSRLRDGEENSTCNFCPVKRVSLVQGRYPPELLKQWDIYDEKKSSENDRPDIFGDDQLYTMLEFGDGGCDLDSCKLSSASQAVSIMQQVACALAVGEQALWFEHRDLHMGNVLVQPTEQDTVTVCLDGQPLDIQTYGLMVSIIDFTLSRLTKDGCTVFCDLARDNSLFEGKGDYQFDIYRMMKKENKNNWERYKARTNVMWLHYLCDKLIHHRHFQETGRAHREALKCLRQAYTSLLDYSSATHFVHEDSLFEP